MTPALPAPDAPLTSRDSTHERIVEAALDCILENGFYRASSNEIARRAGMTWGAIQYYFGTREKLLLAALEVGARDYEHLLATADVAGSTTAERLAKLADLLARQYGHPRYLATLQIVLNLAHNPRTSAKSASALTDIEHRISAQLGTLIRHAIGPKSDPRTELLVFHALRGLVLSHLVYIQAAPAKLAGSRPPSDLAGDCRRVAVALARLIDDGPG